MRIQNGDFQTYIAIYLLKLVKNILKKEKDKKSRLISM